MTVLNITDTIAIVGAGTMGAGLAQVAAAAGHRTLLYDTDLRAMERGIRSIGDGLKRQIERGRMTKADRDNLLANIHPVNQIDSLAGSHLVIEAVIEDLATKQSLFKQLESLCGPKTILASNTSSLSVTAIAATMKHPENLVGMHFFNPAPVMKLVEVISGLATDPAVAERVFRIAKNWGKHPVHVKSTPGFIVNRVARPFYAEAMRMYEEGVASAATLDALMREAGDFRMGPFELTDLIGQDVNYSVTSSIFAAYHNDPRFLPSLVQKEMVDGGLLGCKTGRGFYHYHEGAERPAAMTAATKKAPPRILVGGDLGVADELPELWQAAGIEVQRNAADTADISAGNTRIALSDGRSATRRAADSGIPNTILFDLALDYRKAGRIALAAADQASEQALDTAVGLFQCLGKSVSLVDDTPGLPLMRTVCMLANEAADAVLQKVCSAEGVDTAMQSGLNYPLGPLAWADRISPGQVLKVLENMQQAYGLDRYRPSQLLRRKVESGQPFHPGGDAA